MVIQILFIMHGDPWGFLAVKMYTVNITANKYILFGRYIYVRAENRMKIKAT